ncbi:hypothetical protein BH10PSE10_BH10PSE10_07780 [soil metagenome]
MAQKATRSNFFKRSLAALALVLIYSVSLLGSSLFVSAATSTSAEARGGGRGGGGRGRGGGWGRGRGRGWGRGRGYGYGFIAPAVRGCYWSPRWGRTICPY